MKNSWLYRCKVMHHRLEPTANKFEYNLFMFSIDLDELDLIATKIFFISRNRFNVFNFRDRDHLQIHEQHDHAKSVKDQILLYIRQNNIDTKDVSRVQLITNLCTLGYQFNPVSFYYCFDHEDKPICSVVEVCNTYGEMKLYFLGKETLHENRFHLRRTKNFYVSPFIDLDADFDFNLIVPDEKLKISINDYKKDGKFFFSTLTGQRKALNNWNVLKYALRFPLITLQVITLIHWQALRLLFKGIRYHKKTSFTSLQQQVLKPHKSLIH